MKVFYSFDAAAEFSEDLPKIKTNFDLDDTRHTEWIAEQCIDEVYSPTDESLPATVKLWRKKGEFIGEFKVIVEQRPILQARLILDHTLD